jgi:hypothetical protein
MCQGWCDPDGYFGSSARVVLPSADFSVEMLRCSSLCKGQNGRPSRLLRTDRLCLSSLYAFCDELGCLSFHDILWAGSVLPNLGQCTHNLEYVRETFYVASARLGARHGKASGGLANVRNCDPFASRGMV